MTGLLDAVTFLTRVPLGARVRDETRIARAVPWFPIVGAALGAMVAAVYAAMLVVVPHLVAATIAVATGLLVTGAFHEDGLADVADAFGGGRDREDCLRILKDPRLGTFGVLAIVLTVLIRVTTIATLGRTDALLVIPAAHALSRAAAVSAMGLFAPIDEGLGASYAHELSHARASVGVLGGLVIGAALLRGWVLPAVAIGALCVAVLGALARRKIGGINGDVLGAIQQVTEIGVLLMAAAVAHGGRIP